MGKINENSAKSTKTKNVTPAVTPWGKNRVKNTETGKHVLIMPGIGYTVDRPLLYWAAQALAANGWFVDRLDLKLTESVEFPEIDRLHGTRGRRMAQGGTRTCCRIG